MESFYHTYQSMPNNRKIFYTFLTFAVFLFFSQRINHIFALVIVIIVIGWVFSSDTFHQENILSFENEKLDFLNSLLYTDSYATINDDFNIKPPDYGSHLDKDNQIVDFYYHLRDYFNYNQTAFRKSLLNTNILLGIENFINHLDYAPKNIHEYLESAELEYKEALNNMHTVIFNIPSTRITNYTFNNSLKNLEYLLIQHLDNIKNLVKKKFDTCEISNTSKPIHDYYADPNDQKSKGYSMNYSLY